MKNLLMKVVSCSKCSKTKILVILALVSIFVNSCAVGIGIHSIHNDKGNKLNKNPIFEAEYVKLLGRPSFSDNLQYFKLRAAIAFSYSDLFKAGEFVNRYSQKITISMMDLRIPVRLNIVETKHIIPFIGAGLGYFILRSNLQSLGDYVGSDYLFNYYEINNDITTLAEGFFPFLEGGISVALSNDFYLSLSYKNDLFKENAGANLSGDRFVFSIIYYRW